MILLISCKDKEADKLNNPQTMKNEFISRIHTTDMETDTYKLLGKTSFEKHISDFENIDWKAEYKKEFNSMNFNMPDIEVLSITDSKYLSISIAPNTEDTFQYIIGLGKHLQTENTNNPDRIIKLYMTESENVKIPKKFIALFFKQKFSEINSELKKLYLMEEIKDVYINTK